LKPTIFPIAADIANAVATVLANADKAGAARPGDYLEFEQLLIAVGGPDVTGVHSGRNLRPTEIPYDEARRIYAESARRFDQRTIQLPLSEAESVARSRLRIWSNRREGSVVGSRLKWRECWPTSVPVLRTTGSGWPIGAPAWSTRKSSATPHSTR